MPGSLSPIITLTTDFGLADHYVAAMKGAILRHCPAARLVDVTHQIPRHDIIAGSIAIERAVDVFEEGTIHLGVVDPGVGSGRRILVVRIGGQVVVCPDNGLITWAWRRAGATVLSPSPGTPGEGWGGGFAGRRQPPPYPSPGVPREGTGVETEAFELLWRPEKYSAVFHGRDIMAPAVGILAAGGSLADLVRPIEDPVLLGDLTPAASLGEGRVIRVDHFGNAMTNVPEELLSAARNVMVECGGVISRIYRTYSDVEVGEALALIGSSGMLEIAVREGSAAKQFGIRVGMEVGFR